ncbi:MAG TPA: DUF4395 family protein [Candidatus Bathyarchaeia archaeon]|nr:DUF4395 family protein [Candidatus Bathyarchaeia archaeon]
MLQISTTARERIQAQGFCGLSDATYAQINYPLRLAPAIMMAWVAVGTALGSAHVLWALVPFTALGAILKGHPFDVLYNQGLRHLVGTQELPRYGTRRRFAFAVATTMTSLAAWGFQANMPRLGSIVGAAIVTSTLVNVITGICGPAVVAGRLFGKVKCEEPERHVRLKPSERADDWSRSTILKRSIRGFGVVRPKCEADNAA